MTDVHETYVERRGWRVWPIVLPEGLAGEVLAALVELQTPRA